MSTRDTRDVGKNGVCVIVPQDQEGFRPQAFGMGILVKSFEVVTCARVIEAALGAEWQKSRGQPL
jgi:hypothetical protein